MAEVTRTGVSIEPELLEKFDKVIAKRGYKNRSEALRDLIRESLVTEDIEENRPVVATLSMVYDHHRRDLSNRLNEAQHHAQQNVLAATHVHLDHDNCLEVVVVRGRAADVRKVADALISMKGVKHGRLTITTSGAELK